MPRMDKTGPLGQGPMTGRGFGQCQNQENDLNSKPFARGIRRGMGGVRGGRMRRFCQNYSNFNNFSLEEREKMLLEELEAIRAEKEK